MKKRLISVQKIAQRCNFGSKSPNRGLLLLVVFLLVLSSFGLALEDTSDNCAGFWGSIGCFLWGDASNRAGMSWFEGSEALAG